MMENLSLNDPPPMHPGINMGAMPPGALGRPPQPQQLPAQMFTTAAQLLDLTDSESCPSPAFDPQRWRAAG